MPLPQTLPKTAGNRRDVKRRDNGFEFRGFSQELLTNYSQRSRQRDEAVEDFKETSGRPPTDNEVAVLVRESRPDKLIEISTDELRSRQRSRLTQEQASALRELREEATGRAIAHEDAEPWLLSNERNFTPRCFRSFSKMIKSRRLRPSRSSF